MAVPHPDKELQRAQQVARAGLPPLLVISGPGGWFRDQALAAAMAAVPKDAELVTLDGLDVEIRGIKATAGEVDDDEAEVADDDGGATAPAAAGCKDLDVLRGGGLFFRRAFVVVRRADRWLMRYTDALLQALPRFAKGSGLILEAQKIDKRRKLWKELADQGALFEFRDLYEQPYDRSRGPLEGELVQWVLQKSRGDRKSTRLNSSHSSVSRMPSSA